MEVVLLCMLCFYLGGSTHVLMSIILNHKFAQHEEDRVTKADLFDIACAVVAWPAMCVHLWLIKGDGG